MEAAKPKVSRRGRQQRHSLEFKISIARQVIEAGALVVPKRAAWYTPIEDRSTRAETFARY
jgi:hypothetical protein